MSAADLRLKAHVEHPVGLVHHHVGGPPQVSDASWREEQRHQPSAKDTPDTEPHVYTVYVRSTGMQSKQVLQYLDQPNLIIYTVHLILG